MATARQHFVGMGRTRTLADQVGTVFHGVFMGDEQPLAHEFPLTQDGPVAFRYRIHPHGGYDAVAANRFGLEQAQPLVHVTADKNPDVKPVVAVDNRDVYVTVLKSMGERQRDDCPFAFRVGQGRDCGFGLPGPPSVVRVALPARGAARASRGGDADDETLRHGHVETRFLTTGAWEASGLFRQRAVGASVRG